MEFSIGEKVAYKNLVHEIVDFNPFYFTYTLRTSAGYFVYRVKESELESA